MGRRSAELRRRREARAEAARTEDHLLRTAEERGCLFCRRGDGGFRSQEHVFPETLGNKTLILPRGVVCDRCNNSTLAGLDQAVCEFGGVMIRRTMLGIQSKAGVVPVFRFSEGSMEHVPATEDSEARLIFNSRGKTGQLRETARAADGSVSLGWSGSGGRRMTPRYASELSRALLKSALECLWIDHGQAALEPRFDHVRNAVLGHPRDGFLMMVNKADPDDVTVSLTYHLVALDDGEWEVPVVARYFGVTLVATSRRAEPAVGLEAPGLSIRVFKAGDLPHPRISS